MKTNEWQEEEDTQYLAPPSYNQLREHDGVRKCLVYCGSFFVLVFTVFLCFSEWCGRHDVVQNMMSIYTNLFTANLSIIAFYNRGK